MRKIMSLSSFILGIVFFVAFMVVACVTYYLTAGVFVAANLAALYAALGILGALAMVLRGYIFATLFYIGCSLGWVTGHYVSTLEGNFAPTAGVITTFFLIGTFALVGLFAEISRQKRRHRKKAEQRERERQAEEMRQQALIAEQETKKKAEAEAKAKEEASKVQSTEAQTEETTVN